MPDAKRREIEAIIGRSLLTAETLATELRDRLTDLSPAGILATARAVLDEFEPILAQAMTDAELAAWVSGTDSVVRILPSLAREALEVSAALPPIGRVTSLLAGGADEPIVRFPLIERAAESLLERNIVTREEFDTLGRAARARAFTVAAQDSEDAISTIRNTLAETIDQGASLSEFRKRLGEDLDASFIGPAHRETVFRTNIQTAFHQAHDELANDPIVREIFPYQSYDPINDGRTRPEHLALKTLGIDGTNVYRRDDTEFWNLFLPPWGFSCRCGVTLLSVEAAARRGVIEARIWDRTGVPPANPEHRLQDIPFRPEPDFVGGRRLSLFVRLAQVHAPKGGISIGGKQFKGGEFIPGDVLKNATIDERDQILSGISAQDKKTSPKKPARGVKPSKPPKRESVQFPGAKVDRRIRDGFPKDSDRKKRLRAGSTARLSDEQTEWLTSYTDESESLNSELRKGGELAGDSAEMFDQLTAAIEQSEPLPEGTTVYRGLDLTSQDLMDSMLSRFENSIGQDLKLKGITSTSLDPQISAKFSKRESFVMEIQPKKGLYANGVSEFPDEEEILLKHNAQYRVVSVQRDVRVGASAFRTVVQLKEV